jgi:twinkle protein
MTPLELADYYLGPYTVKGDELIPETCPFCGGGDRHDKQTFALNVPKLTYNCKRGSCGQAGSFRQLCEHFGVKQYEAGPSNSHAPKKHYKDPKIQAQKASSPVEEYLKKRGFSKATWEKYEVGDDGQGNIAMPYYDNGKVVMMKFRPAHKVDKAKGERKAWREEGGKPVFWGMQHCKPNMPLTIVEGEMDLLALTEAGINNVVSVPSGTNDLTCVDLCWDWLQQFKSVILWVDNDEPGLELQRNLIRRLGAWRCYTVASNRKDGNEVLLYDGKDAVLKAYSSIQEVPISGLIRLAEVKPFDFTSAVRVQSGIKGLDKGLGGFMLGLTTVWSGKSTSGKSTLLGQIALTAVDHGYPVCAYSGELPGPIFRYWIDIQAAGNDYIDMVYDNLKESSVARVRPEAIEAIHKWYYDMFFLYDSTEVPNESSMFEVFEYAARRYDCKVFIIDNLMTMMMESAGSERDYLQKQTQIINRVSDFARRMNVHVHLVAHPRKGSGGQGGEDISGTGNIKNRADNVLIMKRLTDKEQVDNGCDSILTIDKNRLFGKQDIDICLDFDEQSKRFTMCSDTAPTQYGWATDDMKGDAWEPEDAMKIVDDLL